MFKKFNTFLVLVLALTLTGCAAHYVNNKTISGKAPMIRTPYGIVEDVEVYFHSIYEYWFPWKFKDAGTTQVTSPEALVTNGGGDGTVE